jgi:protease II
MKEISFSVEDDIYKKIKNHSEINWSEIIQRSIMNHLQKTAKTKIISIEDLRKRLGPKLLQKVRQLDEKEEIKFYKKAKQLELERSTHLKELEQKTDE